MGRQLNVHPYIPIVSWLSDGPSHKVEQGQQQCIGNGISGINSRRMREQANEKTDKINSDCIHTHLLPLPMTIWTVPMTSLRGRENIDRTSKFVDPSQNGSQLHYNCFQGVS